MRKLALIALIVLAPSFAFNAHAQTALKWNERQLDWLAPTSCSDGSPITDCPVTGYRVESASNCASPTWTQAGTTASGVKTFKAASLTAGTWCFRVKAMSAGGDSTPTNAVTATIVAPLPGSPTGLTVSAPTAYEFKPATNTMARVAYVPVGTPCGPETKVISGVTYCRLDVNEADFVNWPTNLKIAEVWAVGG